MYIIISRSPKRDQDFYQGNFPISILEKRLNAGEDLIIISTYSGTVKIPYSIEENGITRWEYKDYELPR
jgi:hypothetical protein